MSDYGDEAPPPEAEGLDRPSDNEDNLDDTARELGISPPRRIGGDDDGGDSDDESILSEVDEAQFDDFDPTSVQVAPDFETLKSIKVNKRKRMDGEESLPKKKKERTREKPRQRQEVDEAFSGGEQVQGKRSRKKGVSGGEKRQRTRVEINEDDLPPDERRRLDLDRKITAITKARSKPRNQKGDLRNEANIDRIIEGLRNDMIAAAEADGELVRQGFAATKKRMLLRQVTDLLGTNQNEQSILDPETNFLEAVRFFLEPLTDGSLPAIDIQKQLAAALAELPMTKDALISSGIGKVIVFYRKSQNKHNFIKRQANQLFEQWSRLFQKRSDDYTKKTWETVEYDPNKPREGPAKPQLIRKAPTALAPGQRVVNRARLLPGATSYTIVPRVSHIPRR